MRFDPSFVSQMSVGLLLVKLGGKVNTAGDKESIEINVFYLCSHLLHENHLQNRTFILDMRMIIAYDNDFYLISLFLLFVLSHKTYCRQTSEMLY